MKIYLSFTFILFCFHGYSQKDTAISLPYVEICSDKPVTAASSDYMGKLDFENRPKNSAQDMLKLVPGLFIAQHAGGGKAEQIFVRGFDCDHGTDVATFVDGIPVNMPSHGHGQGYADLHFLIPETIEGIEIFKGPYSPRFGDFATGAAVKFNTLDSLDNNLIQIETGYVPHAKNFTAQRGLALLQLPDIASNIKSYFAVDVIGNRGYFETDQNFNRLNLFSKTTIAVNEKSHLHFSLSGFGSSWDASGQIPGRAVENNMITRFGSIDNSEGGTTQRNNFNLTYHTQLEFSEFETQVYSCNYRFKLYSNFTFFLDDPIHGDQIEQNDERSFQGINTFYSFPHKLGNLDNKFTIGGSFRSDEIQNQLWHTEKRNRLEVRANSLIYQRSSSLYANEVFRFSDDFRIELGARYDYFIFDVDDLIPSDSTHTNYSGYNYQNLLSPKLNVVYSPSNNLQLFVNAGTGFHSNDARSVVRQLDSHQLPKAIGAEFGTLYHFKPNIIFSMALWWLEMENELVYIGDEGTTEDKGSSRRTGIDLSIRFKIFDWLFADADVNFSRNRFIDKGFGNELSQNYFIPLAPTLTSAGGLTFKLNNNFEGCLRYRYLAERPANELNTVVAKGYNVADLTLNYSWSKIKIGMVVENLFNTEWNEAQFDTESRLFHEAEPVSELHFTPGTPFAARLSLGYIF